MTVTNTLARGTKFYIDTGGATFVELEEINSHTHTASAADADTTTYSDAGRKSHMKASRGDQFGASGLYAEDPDTGERPPGQAAVEAWALKIGPESVQRFRVVSPGGVVREFDATATVNIGGGSNDTPDAWAATITVTGAISNSGAIAVLAAPTTAAGTTANASSVISFSQAGTATEYEVVIYAGSDEVKRVRSSAKPIYVGGLTNGTAYTAKARSRNAGGWSPLSSASSAFTPTA